MKASSMMRVGVIPVLTLLLALAFLVPIAQAQPLPPENPSEPWSPPDEGGGSLPGGEGVLVEGGAPPAPGAQASILSAYMQDELGNDKTEVTGRESIYLTVTVSVIPGNRTTLSVAEYLPTGTPTRHWLYYNWPVESSGTWQFGPFYAQPPEPEGIHTWKIWLNDRTTEHYDEYLTSFSYFSGEPAPEPEEPAAPADVSTVASVTLSSMSIKVNDTITASSTVTPANSGSVTIEQSKDGVVWIPIGSGVATGTVTGQFTPSEPGDYMIRSKYGGYLDSAANKHYLASESSPVILEVTKGFNYLALGLGIGLAVIAGVVIWLRRSKRISFGRA